jgi:hypothetical protein
MEIDDKPKPRKRAKAKASFYHLVAVQKDSGEVLVTTYADFMFWRRSPSSSSISDLPAFDTSKLDSGDYVHYEFVRSQKHPGLPKLLHGIREKACPTTRASRPAGGKSYSYVKSAERRGSSGVWELNRKGCQFVGPSDASWLGILKICKKPGAASTAGLKRRIYTRKFTVNLGKLSPGTKQNIKLADDGLHVLYGLLDLLVRPFLRHAPPMYHLDLGVERAWSGFFSAAVTVTRGILRDKSLMPPASAPAWPAPLNHRQKNKFTEIFCEKSPFHHYMHQALAFRISRLCPARRHALSFLLLDVRDLKNVREGGAGWAINPSTIIADYSARWHTRFSHESWVDGTRDKVSKLGRSQRLFFGLITRKLKPGAKLSPAELSAALQSLNERATLLGAVADVPSEVPLDWLAPRTRKGSYEVPWPLHCPVIQEVIQQLPRDAVAGLNSIAVRPDSGEVRLQYYVPSEGPRDEQQSS